MCVDPNQHLSPQAALHALGSISGVDRPEAKILLGEKAEECLKRLIYTTAANSPKLTPSVSFSLFFYFVIYFASIPIANM